MSYSPDYGEHFRRVASYVDKILKGAKPGELPMEAPSKYEFVINRRTLRSLDLVIPPDLLLRSNEVVG